MTKSKLTSLYKKHRTSGLTRSEKAEFDNLRFKYFDYFTWLKDTYSDDVLFDELKKSDKERALRAALNKVDTGKNRTAYFYISRVAAACIIIFASILLIPNKDDSVNLAENRKVNRNLVIREAAQLITPESSFELNNSQKDSIKTKGFTAVKDKNNQLKYTKKEDKVQFHTVKTPYCGQYSVVLSDGSKIYINSNSEIKYPTKFDSKRREIYVKGEVYCEIAKKDIPFIVHTPSKNDITVLGTKFNVRDYKSEGYAEITLLSGSVKVNNDSKQCLLKPNQQVIISNKYEIRNVEARYYSSWCTPVIRYYKTPLYRVINGLEQMYGVNFIFDNPKLAERLIAGGIVKANSLDKNLEILSKSYEIKFEIREDEILIKESLSN